MKDKEVEEEIYRCLNCVNKPCMKACPLENDVPKIIELLKLSKEKEAYELLSETNIMPSICGRICPYMKQCQSNCTRKYKETPIETGEIEASLGDLAYKNGWMFENISDELSGKKVAVVGSGPAGLTCAVFLKRYGAEVTIYEKREKLGGLLRYGIPDFRLSKGIIDELVDEISKLGINVVTNYSLEAGFEKLKNNYDAIFLSIGANVPRNVEIKGKDLKGVYDGNTLLENGIDFDCENKKIYILGGGNVAIDVSRTVKRLKAKEVTIIYRRSEEEMPAEKKEILVAQSEGIKFIFNTNIIRILGSDCVERIECIETSENDHIVENVNGSEHMLDADMVIMAVGSQADTDLIKRLSLEVSEKGFIKVNENNQTSSEKIFAGGNLIGVKATVAWAARSGRDTAEKIKNYLNLKKS